MSDTHVYSDNHILSAPIIVIIGPTAVGKTELSLSIAEKFSCEIISADSMQVYRYMDIGTAKPSLEEMNRVPHHLIDVAEPDERYNAGRYATEGFEAIKSIVEKNKIPLIVGGTGLYIRALLEGLSDKLPSDENQRFVLKQKLLKEGRDALFAELQRKDPDSAARIHPNDTHRLIRALEIFAITGIPWSVHIERQDNALHFTKVLKIGLACERSLLYDRINRRTAEMIDLGFIDEVRGLLARGYSPELKSMQSLGYKHLVEFISGKWDYEKTISLLARDTRRFAKRQFTWFGKDKTVCWKDRNSDSDIKSTIQVFIEKI